VPQRSRRALLFLPIRHAFAQPVVGFVQLTSFGGVRNFALRIVMRELSPGAGGRVLVDLVGLAVGRLVPLVRQPRGGLLILALSRQGLRLRSVGRGLASSGHTAIVRRGEISAGRTTRQTRAWRQQSPTPTACRCPQMRPVQGYGPAP